jgi:hypothetical protein
MNENDGKRMNGHPLDLSWNDEQIWLRSKMAVELLYAAERAEC